MPTDNDYAKQRSVNALMNNALTDDTNRLMVGINRVHHKTNTAEGKYDLPTVEAMEDIVLAMNKLQVWVDDIFDRTDSTLMPNEARVLTGVMVVGTDGVDQRGFKDESTQLTPFGELVPTNLLFGVHVFQFTAETSGKIRIRLNQGFGEDITPFDSLTAVINGVEIHLTPAIDIDQSKYYEGDEPTTFTYLDQSVGNRIHFTIQANKPAF